MRELPLGTIPLLVALRNSGKQSQCIRKIDGLFARYQKLSPKLQLLLHHLKGDCLLDLSEWELAIKEYSNILKESRDSVAFANRGAALGELGMLDKAVSDYQRAIRCDPNDAVAFIQLGWLQFKRGKIASSIQYLRRAVKSDPKNPKAFALLGDALTKAGKPALADHAYRQVLNLDPSNVREKELKRVLTPND